jgi:hypothetical protein
MAIPLIGGLIAAVAPAIKDVVMDVVKDVAMDVGKSFVDTIGKGVKDFASDMIGKGGKIVGDLIKNPLDALKDIAKKFMPPQFQQLLNMGKTVMQAATSILNKFMEKLADMVKGKDVSVKIETPFVTITMTGSQGAQGAQGAQDPHGISAMNHEAAAAAVLEHQHGSGQSLALNEHQMHNMPTPPSTSSSNTASSSGTASTSGTTEANTSKTDDDPNKTTTVADMKGVIAAAQSGNVDNMMKEYAKVPDKDRPMAMFAMQQELQKINQMMSMMSNIAQVQHDTSKAVINNLRV